jgi:hypothetical protein
MATTPSAIPTFQPPTLSDKARDKDVIAAINTLGRQLIQYQKAVQDKVSRIEEFAAGALYGTSTFNPPFTVNGSITLTTGQTVTARHFLGRTPTGVLILNQAQASTSFLNVSALTDTQITVTNPGTATGTWRLWVY